MMQCLSRARSLAWFCGVMAAVSLDLASCSNGSSLASSEGPPPDSTPPTDTTPPPPRPDTTPPIDTTPPPPTDTTPPPAVNCELPGGASGTPSYVGLPIGPDHVPPQQAASAYSATIHTTSSPGCLIAE